VAAGIRCEDLGDNVFMFSLLQSVESDGLTQRGPGRLAGSC
jgi:hypothetical protein